MQLHVLDAVNSLVLGQAAEGAVSFDLVHMFHTMGFFAKFIASVLFLMSIYSLAIMGERLITYWRAQRASRNFAVSLRDLLPAAKFAEAIQLSKKLKRGHLCKVLGLALEEYSHGVEALAHKGPRDVGAFDVIAAVNRAVDRSSLRTVNDLRRGLGALATVGSTAPFVGLLGTVAGIITAFQAMAATGSGGLGAVSAGIAEALITTAFGLLVAIPAVMVFNYFTNAIDNFVVDMNETSSELISFMLREGRKAS